mgnify:CR=1 FL=1
MTYKEFARRMAALEEMLAIRNNSNRSCSEVEHRITALGATYPKLYNLWLDRVGH